MTLGEAEKVKAILGVEEMQMKLAARPTPRKESAVSTQSFQDTDSKQLYWRQQTDSLLGVRHKGHCPITFNQTLPRAKSNLRYITTIRQGRFPPILERTSNQQDDNLETYLSILKTHPEGHKADIKDHLFKPPIIELE